MTPNRFGLLHDVKDNLDIGKYLVGFQSLVSVLVVLVTFPDETGNGQELLFGDTDQTEEQVVGFGVLNHVVGTGNPVLDHVGQFLLEPDNLVLGDVLTDLVDDVRVVLHDGDILDDGSWNTRTFSKNRIA